MIEKTIQLGAHTLKLSTGKIARQATAAVFADLDGTTVMVTVMAAPEAAIDADFFGLRVDYVEKAYAAGKIPGGFFKREGRPSEREVLISRLIDRPIRPLFPKGFHNEVQVLASVVSLNPEVPPDIVAMIGASCALTVAGLPFQGPMAAARVGYNNGEFLLNPNQAEIKNSDLDLIVAGTKDSVLMVESEAKELPEEVMLKAVMFGQRSFKPIIELIEEFAREVNREKLAWQPHDISAELSDKIFASAQEKIRSAYQITNKQERVNTLKQIREAVMAEFALNPETGEATSQEEIILRVLHTKDIISKIEREHVRGQILAGKPRIDGRDLRTVRPINAEIGILERTHGSSLFTRGETQALVVTTLGTGKDAQTVDSICGDSKENFMLHYNFPNYSVGELGMPMSPKRREIGHGRLAWRGVNAVMPSMTEFPYVVRVVSEITESNGSSSMASVCGASLALMDAGVPIKAPVAGIAMGLIKEQDQFAVLSDILGDEDHLGDMDFKVAGTETGVTALQMDIKIAGITEDIMRQALEQAKEGRLHILGIMNQVINTARSELSNYAPQILTMRIDPDKIRDVVGKGGATIRQITESTGTSIELKDDGTVQIAAPDKQALQEARAQIELLTVSLEIGQIYEGKVVRIADFGAFVNLLPGKDGLLHISQISEQRIENVNDVLQVGQEVSVKVLEIDRQGKIRLSMKNL